MPNNKDESQVKFLINKANVELEAHNYKIKKNLLSSFKIRFRKPCHLFNSFVSTKQSN